MDPVLGTDLLAEEHGRLQLADQFESHRPQVALVFHPSPLPGRRERLAGAGEREDGAVVGPPRLAQGILPDRDAAEQMPLREAFEVRSFDIEDGAFVDLAIGDHAFFNEFAQPLGFSGIPLPVIDHG